MIIVATCIVFKADKLILKHHRRVCISLCYDLGAIDFVKAKNLIIRNAMFLLFSITVALPTSIIYLEWNKTKLNKIVERASTSNTRTCGQCIASHKWAGPLGWYSGVCIVRMGRGFRRSSSRSIPSLIILSLQAFAAGVAQITVHTLCYYVVQDSLSRRASLPSGAGGPLSCMV